MTYMTTAEIEERITYNKDDFFDTDGETRFDDLLTQLEKESRSLIESKMGDITFDSETDKVEEKVAPDSKAFNLPYPIQSISKVEFKRFYSETSWNTLDSGKYTHSKHRLILQSYPKLYKGRYFNQTLSGTGIGIKQFSNRATWSDFCQKLKITYDRGFSSIPENIKNIQISIINKLLRNLKMEQSISALQPDQFSSLIDANQVMTEDIEKRLNEVTSFGHKVVSI